MQIKIKIPLVSVIVPTFDSEFFLERCLDSLVNQTYKDLEILIIDNHSTDSTLEIANKYAYMYPEKVFVKSTHQHGSQALGRNLGIKLARGKYIVWCDSDDYLELQAVELMYNKAVEDDYDIVVCDFYRYENGKKELIHPGNKVISDPSVRNIILDGKYALWNKLIKTDIYKIAGDMPVDTTHIDVTYVPILIQYCKKAVYLASPVYNWIVREGSVTRNAAAMEKTHILTYNYLLEHIKPEYLNCIAINIARMTRTYYDRFYVYGDVQIEYYLNFRKEYIVNNPEVLKHPDVIKMEELISICSHEPMDNIVYINGFNKIYPGRIEFIKENVFNEGCKVIVLNEKTCDVAENSVIKHNYDSGNFDFVAEYFAFKHIYENGGVYLGDCITLNSSLNYIKYNPAFFCYLDNRTISSYIFGGTANNSVFYDILQTYSNTEYSMMNTSERIKNILIERYNLSIEKVTTVRNKEVWLYPPEMFVLCNHNLYYKNITEHNFFNIVNNEEFILTRRSTVASIGIPKLRGLTNTAKKYDTLNEKYTALNEKHKIIMRKNEDLIDKFNSLKLKLDSVKNSYSYRFARLIFLPLRKIRRMIERIFGR